MFGKSAASRSASSLIDEDEDDDVVVVVVLAFVPCELQATNSTAVTASATIQTPAVIRHEPRAVAVDVPPMEGSYGQTLPVDSPFFPRICSCSVHTHGKPGGSVATLDRDLRSQEHG